MAIKDPGGTPPTNPLAFSEIEAEFGQNNDRDMGEWRVSQTIGGLIDQPLDTNIPQSGEIKFSDFFSKRLNVVIDYHSGSTENKPNDGKTKYTQSPTTNPGQSNGNWTVIGGFRNPPTDTSGTKSRMHVNKDIGSDKVSSDSCAVRTGTGWDAGTVLTIEVGSSGAVWGAGGNGGDGGSRKEAPNGTNGGNGTSAIGVQYDGTTIINDGVISTGYGGGGGGGFRRCEREEWFSGPVYSAAGGGGGGGQGLPGGTSGSGDYTGGNYYFDDGNFYSTTSGSESYAKLYINDYLTIYGPAYSVSGVHRVRKVIATGVYTFTYESTDVGTNTTGNALVVGDRKYSVGALNNTTGVAEIYQIKVEEKNIYEFKKDGSSLANDKNNTTVVGDGSLGTKRYSAYTNDETIDDNDPPVPVVDNSPNNKLYKIQVETMSASTGGGTQGGAGSTTAGGDGGAGGEEEQAHGGGGGGGGSNGNGGEGGDSNDGTSGTVTVGGNGASGTHTGSIESENEEIGSGGTGGTAGAAIRRTSGITVNITDNVNGITGSTTATGVS